MFKFSTLTQQQCCGKGRVCVKNYQRRFSSSLNKDLQVDKRYILVTVVNAVVEFLRSQLRQVFQYFDGNYATSGLLQRCHSMLTKLVCDFEQEPDYVRRSEELNIVSKQQRVKLDKFLH